MTTFPSKTNKLTKLPNFIGIFSLRRERRSTQYVPIIIYWINRNIPVPDQYDRTIVMWNDSNARVVYILETSHLFLLCKQTFYSSRNNCETELLPTSSFRAFLRFKFQDILLLMKISHMWRLLDWKWLMHRHNVYMPSKNQNTTIGDTQCRISNIRAYGLALWDARKLVIITRKEDPRLLLETI